LSRVDELSDASPIGVSAEPTTDPDLERARADRVVQGVPGVAPAPSVPDDLGGRSEPGDPGDPGDLGDLGEPITSAEPVDPSGWTAPGRPADASDGRPGENDDVWVVVPVHNEEGMIAAVVDELLHTFPHVVCVDDGSTDGSAAAVAGTRAHLVRHCVNLGQGAALQTGLSYALRRPGARWFVTFDADGQHRVDDARALVDVVRSGRCDAALGSRFLGAATDMPWRKRLVLRAAVALSPAARRLRLTDTHNGLRVFSRTVAEGLQITMNRMAHASEIVALLASGRWRVEEVPVTVRYTDYSTAKGQSLLNGVNILFDLSVKHTGA
jgi:hypothetical protein